MTLTTPRTATTNATAEMISGALSQAIHEHRLAPGTKLGEDDLSDIYGVSRTIVRAALHSLAHQQIIEIKRNRGAYVAQPSLTEAHEVFEARELLEPRTARSAAHHATADDIALLQDHIAQEHAASQVTTRVVARLAPRMVGRGARRGTVVIGSTATEMHNLPISIVADLFRSRRFTVLDLGGNLPPEAFAAAVAAADDVVVAAIGITAPNQHAEIARTIAALREATDVPIMIGGSGISRNDALALGADVAAATGEEAMAALEVLAANR